MAATIGSIYLFLNGLLYAGLGVAYLVIPRRMAAKTDFVLSTGTAVVETRAIYGGMELSLGLLLCFCALRPGWLAFGLVFAVMLYAGFAGGRIVGMIVADSFGSITWKLLLFEVGAVLAGAALLAAVLFSARG